jgi:L-fuconolactonase
MENDVPVIDCHHHFQRRARYRGSFPPPVGDRLDRDFTEDDLKPLLDACGVDKTVLVQLVNDVGETEECLDIQTRTNYVAGVVGWVPLTGPGATEAALKRLEGQGRLVGIRHLIAYEPDPKWLLQPAVLESLAVLADAGLVFEAIPVNDAQFDSVLAMTERLPKLKVALNHLGNPPVPEKGWEPWASRIARAAGLPNMSVKLSAGLALVVRWKWDTGLLRRYSDHVIGLFGAHRVMAGSNWPVILLGASFIECWQGIEDLIAPLPAPEREAILGGTAARIYGLG